MDDWLVERVLTCVEQVPPGRVAAYGDIGRIVGVGPRQVGRVMATYGSEVAWWRITSSYGDLPPHVRDEAQPHWITEGIAWKPNRLGCRIASYRADRVALARDYDAVIATRTRLEDE